MINTIFPNPLFQYDTIDPKLGIKSSMPEIDKLILLTILLWKSNECPDRLVYSEELEDSNTLCIKEETLGKIENFLQIKATNETRKIINNNPLFKSQFESLLVSLTLFLKIARISFVDEDRPSSDERKGENRYAKELHFTALMDIIDVYINARLSEFKQICERYLNSNSNQHRIILNDDFQNGLNRILAVFTENTLYKIKTNKEDIVFNQYGIYSALSTNNNVSLRDSSTISNELVGPTRVLNSFIEKEMHPYIKGKQAIYEIKDSLLSTYMKRVDNYLKLIPTKYCDAKKEQRCANEFRNGKNIIFYGIPGVGKSYMLQNIFGLSEENTQRVVFHPDYTYSDFIGQILPTLNDKGVLEYKFTEGPFTQILKKAIKNPNKNYFLIIEEINRGNTSAIFGDIFQLLDRKDGASIYGITNSDISMCIYGKKDEFIRIPANLFLLATMNTADQNIFVLDTAFQRRWEMQYVKNNISQASQKKIFNSRISWKAFVEVTNQYIMSNEGFFENHSDKRLGIFFIKEDELKENIFAEKVLKYLWDDAFKMRRDVFFSDDVTNLDLLFEKFETPKDGDSLSSILKDEVYQQMIKALDKK